jgi:hypothetical protein
VRPASPLRRPKEAGARPPTPSAASKRVVRAAIRRHPDRERRFWAVRAYAAALSPSVDSLGGVRRCFAEDAHLLFEAFLEVRAQLTPGTPGERPRGGRR